MRAGYSVVADHLMEPTAVRMPLPKAVAILWPERFATSSAAKKAVRRRRVLVGDDDAATTARCSDTVGPGQRLRLLARVSPGPGAGEGRRGQQSIGEAVECIYEDDHLAVVVKPANVKTQGEMRTRIALGLTPTTCCDEWSEPLWRPQHVHRLDTPTSGLLVVAKTGRALRTLSAAFAARDVRKRYRALLKGQVPAEEGTIDEPLSGRPACTHWKVVQRYASTRAAATHDDRGAAQYTLVDFFPVSGRTHQLRRHATSLGHSIVGDTRYGDESDSQGEDDTAAAGNNKPIIDDGSGDGDGLSVGARHGLMLAAVQIALPHPHSGDALDVSMPQPERFERFLSDSGAVAVAGGPSG